MSAVLTTVISNIPWTEVIRLAPKVAESAKNLWKLFAKKSNSSEVSDPNVQSDRSLGFQAMAAMEARTLALEANISDLNNKLLASSEVIKVLAEQNAQLIQCIETNRVRIVWLSVAIGVVAIVAILALILK